MKRPNCMNISDHQTVPWDEIQQVTSLLMDSYRRLRARFGYRNWWPADSPFEVCVGAILTQNTAWRNVVKAIANLKAASALDSFTIYDLAQADLAEMIRPCGYFNVKAARLKNLVRHVMEKHAGDLDEMFALPQEALRRELLLINGVGKETADSILLYAANKPVFVVDAYTKRVLFRHGMLQGKQDYDSMQEFFHRGLERDLDLFKDFHAQFVAVGHTYCKTKPLCTECPLDGLPRHGAEPPQAR